MGNKITFKSRVGRVLIPLLPVNRRTFDILRHELRALRVRLINVLNPLYHLKVYSLRHKDELSINLGSGGKGIPDWVNIEIVRMRDTMFCLDIRRRLPFSDNSAARVFAEHVVEHLDFQNDVPSLFNEVYRILQPGGVLRVIVPDAKKFVEAYLSEDKKAWEDLGWDLMDMPDDIYTPMHIVNHTFHQSGEHMFGYDYETLKFALKRAGFGNIKKQSYGQSVDSKLAIDQKNHERYSLYVEAVK